MDEFTLVELTIEEFSDHLVNTENVSYQNDETFPNDTETKNKNKRTCDLRSSNVLTAAERPFNVTVYCVSGCNPPIGRTTASSDSEL